MTTHRCCQCANWWATNSPPTCRTTTNICPECIPKLFPHKLSDDNDYTLHKVIA